MTAESTQKVTGCRNIKTTNSVRERNGNKRLQRQVQFKAFWSSTETALSNSALPSPYIFPISSLTIFCRCFSLRTSTITKPSLTRPRPTSSLVSPNCIVTCGQVTPVYSTFNRHWLLWMSLTMQSTTSARASSWRSRGIDRGRRNRMVGSKQKKGRWK